MLAEWPDKKRRACLERADDIDAVQEIETSGGLC